MALFLRGLCLLAGYLFGGFLTAEVVARCTAGVSARDIGTGNPGMANIATHLGKKAGLLVLAGDVIKTAAACWFCHQLAPELGLTALLYGGLGAVLGHNWPIWYKGRGGKGVAVTCAWLMLYLPVTGVLCCLAGGVAVMLTGYLPGGAVLIATLAVPSLYEQSILFRFAVIVLAGCFGVPGLACAALTILAMACGSEPFGYDYLYPLMPPGRASVRDGFVRSIWSRLAKSGEVISRHEA